MIQIVINNMRCKIAICAIPITLPADGQLTVGGVVVHRWDSAEILCPRQGDGRAVNVRGGVAILGLERSAVAQKGEKCDENTQREVFHG